MQRYAWPGNVRELLNAMEHAAALGGETLEVADLPTRIRKSALPAASTPDSPESSSSSEVTTLANLEQVHVTRTLEQTGGDRRRAAELLGIDLSTLYRKLKRWKTD